ncbi:helix-turn-helix transcriptional regulator [Pedobacter aquatilis]|uniref:helix-turn-helix domain-containing protein n=1 Tax=Pedobacter aquatilis TaxID=351343 RepID=UPI00292EED24|nr:helix-turn-helix transcriptional regulator [Pedobacter aquatilis]
MANLQPHRNKKISDYHKLMGLPKPEHPLISVINLNSIKHLPGNRSVTMVDEFYSIALKRNFNGKMKYGQQQYDFDEGILFFISPGQVFSIEIKEEIKHTGWLLLIHPDFFWNTSLARLVKKYEFFSYSVSEALHLSDKEETMLLGIMQNIEQEYHSNIDKFSQSVIIAQLELLLTYADRFYHRQFLTRKIANHNTLDSLDDLLNAYFESDDLLVKGLPTVQYVADQLNISPNYLSGLLKVLTGQSTQQHIHNKLIDKAKERLSNNNLSISEIAYQLGFEHSQSFNKLFKKKTNLSPTAYRNSFN